MTEETNTHNLSGKHKLISVFNSVTLFLLSFIIVYFINLLSAFIISNMLGIESVIRNFRLEYLVSPHSGKWNVDNIVIIFISAPLISLFLAGVISRLLNISRNESGVVKLFLVWAFIHSIAFSFGAFIAAVLSQDGIWYAVAWMRVPFYFQILLAIAFIFIMYFSGSIVTIFFHEASYYPNQDNIRAKQLWFFYSGLLPWIVGSVIIALFLVPGIKIYEVLILSSALILILPAFIKIKLLPEIMSKKQEFVKLKWGVFLFTIVLFFMLRFIT